MGATCLEQPASLEDPAEASLEKEAVRDQGEAVRHKQLEEIHVEVELPWVDSQRQAVAHKQAVVAHILEAVDHPCPGAEDRILAEVDHIQIAVVLAAHTLVEAVHIHLVLHLEEAVHIQAAVGRPNPVAAHTLEVGAHVLVAAQHQHLAGEGSYQKLAEDHLLAAAHILAAAHLVGLVVVVHVGLASVLELYMVAELHIQELVLRAVVLHVHGLAHPTLVAVLHRSPVVGHVQLVVDDHGPPADPDTLAGARLFADLGAGHIVYQPPQGQLVLFAHREELEVARDTCRRSDCDGAGSGCAAAGFGFGGSGDCDCGYGFWPGERLLRAGSRPYCHRRKGADALRYGLPAHTQEGQGAPTGGAALQRGCSLHGRASVLHGAAAAVGAAAAKKADAVGPAAEQELSAAVTTGVRGPEGPLAGAAAHPRRWSHFQGKAHVEADAASSPRGVRATRPQSGRSPG